MFYKKKLLTALCWGILLMSNTLFASASEIKEDDQTQISQSVSSSESGPYIIPLRPGESDNEEVNIRLNEARAEWWNDSAFFGLLGHNPELLETTVKLFQSAVNVPGVPLYILELMRLKGSEINECEYCINMRFKAVKEKVSLKEGAIFGTVDSDKLDRKEFLAVSLAEKMSRDPNSVTRSFFEELKTEFTEKQILGLVYASSAFSLGNKINSTLKIEGIECTIPRKKDL